MITQFTPCGKATNDMNCKSFTLYTSDCYQEQKNVRYPHANVISSFEDLAKASTRDNTTTLFNEHGRKKDNFVSCDCFGMDLDNGHTENFGHHKTIEDIKRAFPDVAFYYVYSRNHLKEKRKNDGTILKARYKVHVYFPLSHVYDHEQVQQLGYMKLATGCLFPYFDAAAIDIARFFYGIQHETAQPGGYVPGNMCINQYLTGLGTSGVLKASIKATLEDATKCAVEDYGEDWSTDPDHYKDLSYWIKNSSTITGATKQNGATYNNIGIATSDFAGEPSIATLDQCKHVEKFLHVHNVEYTKRIQGVMVYYFVKCPWENLHTTPTSFEDSKITVLPLDNGKAAIRYNCYHGHCSDKGWSEFKAFYEERDGKKSIKPDRDQEEAARLADKEEHRAYTMGAFLDKIQTEAYKPQKTGLDFLDDLLNGGIINQSLTVLVAPPGHGKTTLCVQIAEKIAETKRPVVYMCYEMSHEQLLAKALSERLYRSHKEYSVNQILQGYAWNDTARRDITAIVEEYDEKQYPYIQYNPDEADPERANVEHLQKSLTQLGERARTAGEPAPIVFIDYLHILAKSGADVKDLIKDAVYCLKNYAKDYNTCVFAIAASNRDANKKSNLDLYSGRDSSNIEYGCDNQISLTQEAGKSIVKGKPRYMVLQLHKARFGESNLQVKIMFDGVHNRFYKLPSEKVTSIPKRVYKKKQASDSDEED